MKVTNDKTENSQAFMTIEMEPSEVEESLEASYYRLVKKTNIPGFRKGKAPRAILERYIGTESLFEEAINNLIPQAYEQAIKKQNIEPIAKPHIDIAQTDPVIFKVTVPLPPTIKLGDYHHLKVVPEPLKLAEDDVNIAIEQLRHQHAIWEPVERPVEFDDLIFLDLESSIDGKPFMNQEGIQYRVVRNYLFPAPGFAEQLSGMRRDEEKEFKLQFPLDFPRGELAEKEAWFKVRVTEIKQEKLPELNDEFATEINPDLKTLDSLREQVATSFRLKAEERAKIDFEERVIEAVVDLAKVEFPPILTEMEIDRILIERLRYLQREGRSFEEYLSSKNKTEEELRGEIRPLSTKRVTNSLVLGKIAEEEKIEVNDTEIEADIEGMVESATDNKDELNKFLNTPQSRESIKRSLISRKTIQRLVEIAKGSDISNKIMEAEE
ncbi:MAG TPA: trigger factor [Dehalococcoidia bacterium]|nr:trigger factor [Dehalococcoidia bacterium]